jgi:hypothetical protein
VRPCPTSSNATVTAFVGVARALRLSTRRAGGGSYRCGIETVGPSLLRSALGQCHDLRPVACAQACRRLQACIPWLPRRQEQRRRHFMTLNMAYLLQETAAAVNPTFSVLSGGDAAATIAVFKQ